MCHYTDSLTSVLIGNQEFIDARELLDALQFSSLPEGFADVDVRLARNLFNDRIFLVNGENQYAIAVNGKLEHLHSMPDSGFEGLLDEVLDQVDEKTSKVDLNYLMGIMQDLGMQEDERYIKIDKMFWADKDQE